jgi:hypothetical protein
MKKIIRLTGVNKDAYGAFESLKRTGSVNDSQGNKRRHISELPSNPPYITVG